MYPSLDYLAPMQFDRMVHCQSVPQKMFLEWWCQTVVTPLPGATTLVGPKVVTLAPLGSGHRKAGDVDV